MLLKSKDGIKCDLCGNEFKHNFQYFSMTAKKVIVDVDAKNVTKVDDDLNVDACEKCFNVIKDRVREVISRTGG